MLLKLYNIFNLYINDRIYKINTKNKKVGWPFLEKEKG